MNISLSEETKQKILQHIELQGPVQIMRNMIKALDEGKIEVLESSSEAPPAQNGETKVTLKFHLKAVG